MTTPNEVMRAEDRKALVKLYEGRFKELGVDVRTLGWKSYEEQALRFKVLCEVGDLSGSSVCDIGCGFGDLLPFLRERFHDVSYTGIDIVPSLLEKAQELHPGIDFICQDIVESEYSIRHDYFLSSGALSFRIEDNICYSRRMIEKMFHLANRGIAVNFLTSYVNFQRPHNFHYRPEEMFAFGKTLTRWVTIRHDYPLWEFTLYLHKNPRS